MIRTRVFGGHIGSPLFREATKNRNRCDLAGHLPHAEDPIYLQEARASMPSSARGP